MALTDFLGSASEWIGPALTVGGGIYDYIQSGKTADEFRNFAKGGIIDPFGETNRSFYQGKLSSLYNDPSSLENLPGFKFARDQGMQAVNREMARTGQFLSPNRFEKLAEYVTGLSSQVYGQEADRLAQLSGSQFRPEAASAGNALASATNAQANQGRTIGGTLGELFGGGAETGGLFDKAGGIMDAFGGGGGEGGGIMDSISGLFGGGGGTAATGSAVPGGAFTGGPTGLGLQTLGGPGGGLGLSAGGSAFAGGIGSLAGATGTGMGAVGTAGLAGSSLAGLTGSQALAATGPMGAFMGGGMGAGQIGTALGTTGASTGAAGTAAGAGGAMSGLGAVAGPLAIAAVAARIGKGIYDVVQHGKARTKSENTYQSSGGQALSSQNAFTHPTLGQGYKFSEGGRSFFVTEQDAAPLRTYLQYGGSTKTQSAVGASTTLASELDQSGNVLGEGSFVQGTKGASTFSSAGFHQLKAGTSMAAVRAAKAPETAAARRRRLTPDPNQSIAERPGGDR